MKRVLCILSSLDAGGAETFLMKIYRALPPEEFQMDFVVSADGGSYTREVLDRGGKIFLIPMRTKDLKGAMSQLRRIVSDNGYTHVLKLGNGTASCVDLLVAKWGGAKKRIMRSCNALSGLSWKAKLGHLALQPALNWVANVKLAPSMLAAEFTFGRRQARKNVHLLNNGVDLNLFRFDPEARQTLRREFGLEDKLVVGHVGRFNKQKNHMFLLDVFYEIQKKQENARLVLIGQGELEGSIREKIARLGITDKVIFTGLRSDVPRLLSALDVVVFPSFHEGMPNVIIEAQATGLPCVIADTITRDADITGLVEYLPLELSAKQWAERALLAAGQERRDTSGDFKKHAYDIESVSERFVTLLFGEGSGDLYEN